MQTPSLGLPYIAPQQAQKHVTVNEAVRMLDALVQITVLDRDLAAPPPSPTAGDRYIPGSGASGAWSGQDNMLAAYQDGAWAFYPPSAGWLAWVADEDRLYVYDGAGWVQPASGDVVLDGDSDTKIRAPQGDVIAFEFGGVELGRLAGGGLNLGGASTPDDGACLQLEKSIGGRLQIWDFYGSGSGGANPYLQLWATNVIAGPGPRAAFLMYNQSFEFFDQSNAASLMFIQENGGVRVGSPIGGDKGVGSLNAEAIYDDNTLLSCYVFDQILDGAIDDEKWDAKTPDRITPALTDRETGETIRPEKRSRRRHQPMRRFKARIGTDHDPLTLDGYAKHWKEKRHLAALPNETHFDPEAGLSAGEWVQRLVETAETQAVLIETLNHRLKIMEARQAQ